MRTNLPVSDRQISLDPRKPIVSETDAQGRIRSANEEFVALSGFTREELMGQPHNIVRHPHMPPAAFGDLWASLKAGKSWSGLVKNRAKSGDFYWVRANAYPIVENGQTTGYASIRVAPDRWEIEAAERVYALVNSGKAKHLGVKDGAVTDSSLTTRIHSAFFGTLTHRQITTTAASVAFMAAIAAVAISSGAAVLPVIAVTVLGAVVSGGFSLTQGISVGHRVAVITQAMRKFGENGDFGARAPVVGSDDVGQLAQAFNRAMQDMGAITSDIGRVTSAFARGDFTLRVEAHARGDLAAMKNGLNQAIQELSNGLGAILNNIRQMASALGEASAAISQVSDGAQSQLHAVKEIASVVDQTADAVQEVSSNAQRSSVNARSASAMVEEGRSNIEGMVSAVTAIAENSREITKITDVISKIAGQTNMLALNAAIEAARAGEAGKGFAVVAEEVGKLAEHSGRSVGEIVNLIAKADEQTVRGVEMSRSVGDSIQRIAHGVAETDRMAEAIAAAVEEQSAAVTSIRNSVDQLSHIGVSNATASEELTATMMDLSRLADRTRSEVERFKL